MQNGINIFSLKWPIRQTLFYDILSYIEVDNNKSLENSILWAHTLWQLETLLLKFIFNSQNILMDFCLQLGFQVDFSRGL